MMARNVLKMLPDFIILLLIVYFDVDPVLIRGSAQIA